MNKKKLWVAISTTVLITGCAGMGKEGRIGANDGSDPCFVYLDRLDQTAVYYKDQRMKDITAGALVGAGTGVLAGVLAGGSDAAMIAGGLTGAIAGGFVADAYWKNKLQTANNQTNQAILAVESDVKEDIDKLSAIDRDIAELVRCRTNQRDAIKKQFMEKKLSLQQAQQAWEKWGKSLSKDRDEIKYLNDALDNIRKIEESYSYAAAAIDSPAYITEDMQRQWQQELDLEKQTALANAEQDYQMQVSVKKIKPKEKKKLAQVHKQKVSEINSQFASKEAAIKNKISPKPHPLKLMVSSVHEKHESIRKNGEKLDQLAAEAGNSNGFEQINSKLLPSQKPADIFV